MLIAVAATRLRRGPETRIFWELPPFFPRGHALPKFNSFFHAPEAHAGLPRARGPEKLA